MSMTLEQMKLAVCEKLPELIWSDGFNYQWRDSRKTGCTHQIHWPTEGLQVCHEAEKLLSRYQKQEYGNLLQETTNESVVGYVPDYNANLRGLANIAHSTYEQRLEALCRVWFPEKWQ